MKLRDCPVCNTSFSGRSDKRFCSDQCRATANNHNRQEYQKEIIHTNKILRKNRTILKTLCPVGKSTVRKSVLVDMGYNFAIFSSLYRPRSGILYYLCYDYGFSPIVQGEVERVLIISRQQYVGVWNPWSFVQ